MFLISEHPHVHLHYVFIFDVPTFWTNGFTLPCFRESYFSVWYLVHLFPEFGANQIKKSLLDHLNDFMLPHILLDHFLFTSLVTKCDFYCTTLFSKLQFVAPHVKKMLFV